jgi:hypothetical protein
VKLVEEGLVDAPLATVEALGDDQSDDEDVGDGIQFRASAHSTTTTALMSSYPTTAASVREPLLRQSAELDDEVAFERGRAEEQLRLRKLPEDQLLETEQQSSRVRLEQRHEELVERNRGTEGGRLAKLHADRDRLKKDLEKNRLEREHIEAAQLRLRSYVEAEHERLDLESTRNSFEVSARFVNGKLTSTQTSGISIDSPACKFYLLLTTAKLIRCV